MIQTSVLDLNMVSILLNSFLTVIHHCDYPEPVDIAQALETRG